MDEAVLPEKEKQNQPVVGEAGLPEKEKFDQPAFGSVRTHGEDAVGR
jgi:hypothetical protein